MSFKNLMNSYSKKAKEKPLIDRLKSLRFDKHAYKGPISAGSSTKKLCICIVLDEIGFKNEDIWREWTESDFYLSSATKVVFSTSGGAAVKSQWVRERLAPIQLSTWKSRHSVEYLRHLLHLLQYAAEDESCSRFVVCSGGTVPVTTLKMCHDEVFAHDASWMKTYNEPKTNAFHRIDSKTIPFESIWRSEQTGMVLTRRHLGAILNVPGYTKADLTAAWTTATYPELSYFPTLLEIIGCVREFVPWLPTGYRDRDMGSILQDEGGMPGSQPGRTDDTLKTTLLIAPSTTAGGGATAAAAPTGAAGTTGDGITGGGMAPAAAATGVGHGKMGGVVLQRGPVYAHWVNDDRDYDARGRLAGEGDRTIARFSTLSHAMMVEFRQAGALFAAEFDGSQSLLEAWRHLVGLPYENRPHILRLAAQPYVIPPAANAATAVAAAASTSSTISALAFSASSTTALAKAAATVNQPVGSSVALASAEMVVSSASAPSAPSAPPSSSSASDQKISRKRNRDESATPEEGGSGEQGDDDDCRDDEEQQQSSSLAAPGGKCTIWGTAGETDEKDRDADGDSEEYQRNKKIRKPTVKIIINSNINYRKPLSMLLQSIINSDFLGCPDVSLGDVIVSVSQSPADRGPRLAPLGEVADGLQLETKLEQEQEGSSAGGGLKSAEPGHTASSAQIVRASSSLVGAEVGEEVEPGLHHENGNGNGNGRMGHDSCVVVINATMNSFDWTGHHQLHRYAQHPLVKADYYVHLLDTSCVDSNFWRKVQDLVPRSGDPQRERLIISLPPHSSICIIGSGVVRNYSYNFGREISKNDGLTLEMFEKPIFYADGYVLHGITRFADVQRMAGRLQCGKLDWYGTGQPRHIFSYSDMGVKKSILIGKSGDINGDKSRLGFNLIAGTASAAGSAAGSAGTGSEE